MRPWVALALIGSSLAMTPGTAACSLAAPDGILQDISWLDNETLLGTTEPFGKGIVDLENGTVRTDFYGEVSFSPDRRFVVLPRAGPDVQTGPSRLADSCGWHYSRHVVALDRQTGAFELVARGPVWGLAANAEGVLTFDGDKMHVLEWGSWRELRSAAAPDVVEPLSYRSWITLTPRADAYIDWNAGALVSLDGKTSRPLAGNAHRLASVTFSPDGDHLATSLEIDLNTSEIRIYRLPNMELVARERTPAAWRSLAWGPGGLAWIDQVDEEPAALHVWAEAPREGPRAHRALDAPIASFAWRPDGAAIAVATKTDEGARVLMLGPALNEIASYEVRLVNSSAQEWREALAQVPIPEYSTVEKVRATPGARVLALAVAFAIGAGVSRPSRGTSPALRR